MIYICFHAQLNIDGGGFCFMALIFHFLVVIFCFYGADFHFLVLICHFLVVVLCFLVVFFFLSMVIFGWSLEVVVVTGGGGGQQWLKVMCS